MELKPLPLAGVVDPGTDPYLAYLRCTALWLEAARLNPWIDALKLSLRETPLTGYCQELDFTTFYGHDDYARKRIARRYNGLV
ncbi:MAG: hypothetical protein LUF83_08285 [Alistipes sp.]|nr:hypothetical protein [Alistipes sp.]